MTLADIRQTLTSRTLSLAPKLIFRPDLTLAIESLKVSSLGKSGLHLWNDDLERSHHYAQEESSAEGSYWHGLMHRRERDFDNALYWFRQVGSHPVIDAMHERHPEWSAQKMTEWCRKSSKTETELAQLLAEEMNLLLDYCLTHF